LGVAAAALCRSGNSLAPAVAPQSLARLSSQSGSSPPDYTLHFESSAIEIAPERIISAISYNGQFPGPLLHFKERQSVTMEVQNDTDTPEQLHWHGQFVSPDVDGAAEEGTPFIPARGMRRIVFTPRPAGFRFYHTHNRAGADLCYRTLVSRCRFSWHIHTTSRAKPEAHRRYFGTASMTHCGAMVGTILVSL